MAGGDCSARKAGQSEMTVNEYNHIIGNLPGNPPPNIKMVIVHNLTR